MHPYRGRSGPSRAVSSNVQCQKSRHYSYECKAAPQERPYIARPSRTQQLFNPKLLPKLSSENPNTLQEKKGIADEELAKREAERARKREREMDEEAALRDSPPPKGRRSPSYDSISSISTRSPSPAPRRSRSPQHRGRRRDTRSLSSRDSQDRRRSYGSAHRHPRGPSESPERSVSNRSKRPLRSPSPRRRRTRSPSRERGASYDHRRFFPDLDNRARDSYARRTYSRSRSPMIEEDGGDKREPRRYRARDDHGQHRRSPPPPRQPSPRRERSLSPFSKRLALTQAMNKGR
ncbi:hypothetical protein N657DRAFT_657170 [Parathielavia appendiculata]|uniref:Zinc knuckle-domain-containing protein n=1 Tax=Parathielavia appendiculata TaxID=2587402 RepID=A0AAN6TYU5_9PEZI|nr:hypothetical protein N657DRAFT_657170 [Parathielavia appendiculata]